MQAVPTEGQAMRDLENELIIELLPSKETKTRLDGSVSPHKAQRSPISRRASFLQVLEAASARDRKLALANRQEAELKLALEMSLCQSAEENGEILSQTGACMGGAESVGSPLGDGSKLEELKLALEMSLCQSAEENGEIL